MKILNLFVFITAILLISCNPQDENRLQTNSPGVSSVNDTLHLIKEFNGLLINSIPKKFISCDNSMMIHLVEKNDQADTILNTLLPNAYDGESIYLAFLAEIKPSPDPQYADILEIKKFLKAEQKNSSNTCIPYDFWCKGNEPFWQLQISEKENLIDFYDPMQQTTNHFIYNAPEEKDGALIYSAKNSGNEITVRLKKERCSDGMSETNYDYRAEVIINSNKFNGCAVKNPQR
jgi:uncharacterized membrane protein